MQQGIAQVTLPSVLTKGGDDDNNNNNNHTIPKQSPSRQYVDGKLEVKLTLQHKLHGPCHPDDESVQQSNNISEAILYNQRYNMDESKEEAEFDKPNSAPMFPTQRKEQPTKYSSSGSIVSNSVQATRQLCIDAYTRYVECNDDTTTTTQR
jgi:hypothetical protein